MSAASEEVTDLLAATQPWLAGHAAVDVEIDDTYTDAELDEVFAALKRFNDRAMAALLPWARRCTVDELAVLSQRPRPDEPGLARSASALARRLCRLVAEERA